MKKHLLLRIGRFLRPYLLTLFLITVLMVGANLLALTVPLLSGWALDAVGTEPGGVNFPAVLRNCAKEPEITDLQNFLNAMGARVSGAGSSMIVIEGVNKLHGVTYRPIPDRIIAGTYIIAAAMCGGSICLEGAIPEHISSLIAKLSKTACKISCKNDKISIRSKGRLKSLERIDTMYYPGFPTDLQTQMMALQTISRGTSVIAENIFETRFKTVPQLIKMGADITVRDRTAVVRGVPRLHGAQVSATDLRGGASLVLAGLAAEGVTEVKDIYHIDRGYEDMAPILSSLGAKISRTV